MKSNTQNNIGVKSNKKESAPKLDMTFEEALKKALNTHIPKNIKKKNKK